MNQPHSARAALLVSRNLDNCPASELQVVGVTPDADHVIRHTPSGRLFRVDLVIERVYLCVGIAPRLAEVA